MRRGARLERGAFGGVCTLDATGDELMARSTTKSVVDWTTQAETKRNVVHLTWLANNHTAADYI